MDDTVHLWYERHTVFVGYIAKSIIGQLVCEERFAAPSGRSERLSFKLLHGQDAPDYRIEKRSLEMAGNRDMKEALNE